MKVIVCVDDNLGILFNNRRVSKDKLIIEDIKKTTNEINIDIYSISLFEGFKTNITSELTFGYNFIEKDSLLNKEALISEITIYYFNRKYPSSLKLELDLNLYKIVEQYEFVGNSHEKITKVIYRRIDEEVC